ncbi:MAG: Unknown protein [uncultured Sulfurovum sp.]|uniref:Uncharacterized protein n=1 Tax=uncultured Sulfurovum sp. TaxID=269237 RepID=A0A6S6TZW7_9BACT|nr:MAG: Unknown protein [uncultured Sulfurovum sp.]
MSKKQIKIQTITPRYDEIEDRIRLSLNHEDTENCIDFMMTRRFVLKLLPSIDEYMLKVYYKEMNQDTTTPAKHKGARIGNHNALKLYQENAELLLGIQFSFMEKNKLTQLKFNTKYTEATVTLNYESFMSIVTLIRATTPNFDWGISPDF